MSGPWPRRMILLLLGIAVIAGFAYALREKPALVDLAAVREAPMTVSVEQEGVTRVRDIYTVSTPIAGHLSRTTLEVGDRVLGNETVVASIHPLDPPLIDVRSQAELQATLDAALAAVRIAEIERDRANTAFELARTELERVEKLARSGTVPERTVENARSTFRLQEAQVNAALATIRLRQAEVASAEARLMQPRDVEARAGEACCVRLTAPADGVVLELFAESEQAVAAGARIAEIGNPAELEIVVDLLSADAVRIRPGTVAAISDWGGEEVLQARVRRVDPSAFTKISALGIEEQRVNAVLDFEDPDQRLGHGFRVMAEIPIWQSERAVQAPISSLFRVGSQWMTFRLDGDRLSRTAVSIGRMNSSMAEILDGLSPGDLVVIHPGDSLQDGSLAERRPEGT